MSNTRLAKPPKVQEQVAEAAKFLRYREEQAGVVEEERSGVRALVAKVVARAKEEQLFADSLGGIVDLDVLIDWAKSLDQLGGVSLLDKKHPSLKDGRAVGTTGLYGSVSLCHNEEMFDPQKVLEILATMGLPEDFLTLFHELIHRKQRDASNRPLFHAAVSEVSGEVNKRNENLINAVRSSFMLALPLGIVMTIASTADIDTWQRITLFSLVAAVLGVKLKGVIKAACASKEEVSVSVAPEIPPFLLRLINEVQAYLAEGEIGKDHGLDLLDQGVLLNRLLCSDLFLTSDAQATNGEYRQRGMLLMVQVAKQITTLRSLKVSHIQIAELIAPCKDESGILNALQTKIDELQAETPEQPKDLARITKLQQAKRDHDILRLKTIAREEVTAVLRSPEYVEYVTEKRRRIRRDKR